MTVILVMIWLITSFLLTKPSFTWKVVSEKLLKKYSTL